MRQRKLHEWHKNTFRNSVTVTKKSTQNIWQKIYKTNVTYQQDAKDIWQSKYTSRCKTENGSLHSLCVVCCKNSKNITEKIGLSFFLVDITSHSDATLSQVHTVLQSKFSYKQEGICFTCSTMGSCSGGLRFSLPYDNQTWNAVSCSAKNGLCSNAVLSSITLGSWARQWSSARSHACLHKTKLHSITTINSYIPPSSHHSFLKHVSINC